MKFIYSIYDIRNSIYLLLALAHQKLSDEDHPFSIVARRKSLKSKHFQAVHYLFFMYTSWFTKYQSVSKVPNECVPENLLIECLM